MSKVSNIVGRYITKLYIRFIFRFWFVIGTTALFVTGSLTGSTRAMVAYTPDKWIDQLMTCSHLPEPEMKILCERVRAILMEESNIQPVSSPVTICGDIHGQFWDLLELLRKGGKIPETSYIFMVSALAFEVVWLAV
jgi:hypothetical protein